MRRRQILCFVFGLLLVLALGEGFLHTVDPFDYDLIEEKERFGAAIMDPQTGQLRPGAQASYLGKPTRVSAQGLRNPVVTPDKPAGDYRILCLGGSVVFGWGVGEGEEYPRLLEDQLQQAGWPVGRRAQVINAGVPGRLGSETLGWLQAQGASYRPDLVCLLLVATDLGVRADLGMRIDRQFLSPELRRLRLLRALENRLVFGGLGNRVGGSHSIESEVDDAAMPVLGLALRQFAQLCTTMGAQPLLIDTLGRSDVRPMAEQAGIWYLDGFVPSARRRAWEVAPTDPHMGVEGHRYYAELIAKSLLRRRLK